MRVVWVGSRKEHRRVLLWPEMRAKASRRPPQGIGLLSGCNLACNSGSLKDIKLGTDMLTFAL